MYSYSSTNNVLNTEGCLAHNCTSLISGSTPLLFTQLIQTLAVVACSFGRIDDYPRDRTPEILDNLEQPFDFIIVGGGSAGSVLASRLSEEIDWKVLLIEAGTYPSAVSDVPGAMSDLLETPENYNYPEEAQSDFCLGMIDKRCDWYGGKALGGTSVINGMIYLYGNPSDYDSWAAEGNEGWSYDDVLPYFKKSNNYPREIIDKYGDRYLGSNGPVSVRLLNYTSYFQDVVLEATAEKGIPKIDIFNTDHFVGFGRSHVTANNGRRVNAARAYLSPAKNRKNLYVMPSARADKVLMNGTRATGVQVTLKNGRTVELKASKEVVLSAGTMGSPKLLMLSGIGPRRDLEEFNIECLADLPVGKHFKDQLIWPGMFFEFVNVNKTQVNSDYVYEYLVHNTGPLAGGDGGDFMGFINVEDSASIYPDVQLFVVHSPPGDSTVAGWLQFFHFSPELISVLSNSSSNSSNFFIAPVLVKPKSSGEVKLRSKFPGDHVKIYQNYLSDDRDKVKMFKALEFIKSLLETKAFKDLGVKLREVVIPGCENFEFDSSEYWECNLRHTGHSYYHSVGTVRMGTSGNPKSVVDSKLKVLGIEQLRVIDASIMPDLPSANTYAPTLMVAEKGADIIKNKWLKN